MKIMFISDIHGIKTNLEKVREEYQKHQCNKLVVLGDLYYMGPKQKVIDDYDSSYVNEFLESFQDNLICMRGNCDSDVDKKISNFPILEELSVISTGNLDIYLTHGNIYNEDNWKKNNSILVYGHYHIPFIKEKGNNLFINPGSISLPRGDYDPSYMILEDDVFTIYDISGKELFQKKV